MSWFRSLIGVDDLGGWLSQALFTVLAGLALVLAWLRGASRG